MVQGVVFSFFFGSSSVQAFVDEGLKVFILIIVVALAESAIAGQIVALVTFLLVMIEQENNEAYDESPAQQEVYQREERHCQQNLGVKLSDHCHLALVAAIQILYFAHMNLL